MDRGAIPPTIPLDVLFSARNDGFVLSARAGKCARLPRQAGLGTGDKSVMLAEEQGIKAVLASPGVREWWTENPYGFSKEFRSYVARLAQSADMTS